MSTFTVLAGSPFFGPFRNGTVSLTCHNGRMCRNGQGVLMPLAPEIYERFDDKGLSWFLGGSFFDPGRSVVAVGRSPEVDWTGLGSFDVWFPYSLGNWRGTGLVRGSNDHFA